MNSNPTSDAPPPLPIDDAMLAKPLSDNRGVQAAKFSLYAVGMVFLLGCVLSSITSNAAKDAGDGARSTARMVGMAIGVLNLSLIVAAFAAGIYALISMRRFGRRGILWRAIAGVNPQRHPRRRESTVVA